MAEIVEENPRVARMAKARAAKKAVEEATPVAEVKTEVTETEEVKEIKKTPFSKVLERLNQSGSLRLESTSGGKFKVFDRHRLLQKGSEEKCRNYFEQLIKKRQEL